MQLLYSGYGRSFVVVSLLCLFVLCSSFSPLSLSQRYPLQVLEVKSAWAMHVVHNCLIGSIFLGWGSGGPLTKPVQLCCE